jgi:putative transposase
MGVENIEGHVSNDHAHLFVSCPPRVSASYLMHRIKGKTSRKLLQEYSHLSEHCWGRSLWTRGFCAARIEYIRAQDLRREDGDFRADGESR